ncbi:CHY zinc finger domain-containing protein [Histoplasma capsulatum var. duboisii H88]|uniref:CHY zinc finger domain-containing protein n=1 Tax=Ajellomyces capsulatus (strain H88) TaxID=544711 RepID=A0A8A1LP33_AJEC8|nr:CHY zinc finger domain-containing protein [Histoplasma capsulatum var. duboisii H88]
MSRYISSYLSEPLLRRARQLHGSLSDQSDTGPETQRTRPGNGESRGEVGVTGMANSNRSIDVRHMPSGDEVSFAIPEEVSHSSTPHYEDDNTYRHSDIDARDPSLPLHHFSARTHVAVLEETDGTVERPSLDSIDGMSQPQTPLSGPVPVDSSSRTIGSNVRIGGIVQVREPDGRSSGHSELYYAADFHLEVKSGSALPEDDGMRTLREKIHNIRDAKISNAEKARLIHALMTENYNSSLHKRYSKSRSPTSCHDQERPCIPVSHSKRSSGPFSMSPTSPTSASSLGFPYHLTDDDLRPSYAPRHDSSSDLSGESIISFPKESANDDAVEEENLQLGCQHYKRKVKLQCYTCKAWYPCRFCHDQEEDHVLIRRATQNMLCMVCRTPQAAGQWCKSCGIQAACYYCSVCKLWDNDSQKSIYHCNDCGICRIGQGIGKDYYHCKTCSVCIPISIQQTHRCIERSTQCDCPICGDYMFTSPETVIFMKCGHSIHQKCFSQYSTTSYRCPICSKTIANMEAHFRSLDRTINDQPMPPDFMDTRALISCNDCSAKSAVQYHWLGLKCEICYSYNTTQIQLLTANDNNDENTHEANEIRNISRNITVPTRMTRLPPNSDENHTPTETTFLSTMSRSVPAHDSNIILGTLQSTDQTTSYRRSFSTIPLRTVPAVIGNYFGLRRQSDSFWSSSAPASDEDKNRSNNNDNEDIDFWGSKASRPTFGIFGDGKDDDETVLFEDESENTDGSDYSSNDEHQEDTEEEDEDDIDEIDIFGHR